MTYTSAAAFELRHPARDVSVTPGSSQFTRMLEDYSSEVNTFMDVTSDICSYTVASLTTEMRNMHAIVSDLIEAHIVYFEQIKHLSPLTIGTSQLTAPSIHDAKFLGRLKSLKKESREEKPVAYSYNLRTGQSRAHY